MNRDPPRLRWADFGNCSAFPGDISGEVDPGEWSSSFPNPNNMTYEEAVKLLKSGPLRFGDETQIEAVNLIEQADALRGEYKNLDGDYCKCSGTGKISCAECEGEGECPHCGHNCGDCDGTGKVKCEHCAVPTEKQYQKMTLKDVEYHRGLLSERAAA